MKSGLKCKNSYIKLQDGRGIVKCQTDSKLCCYQFFCPNVGHYINSDGCINCKKYIGMEEI